jgi:GAF domain-containing protein
MRAAFMQTAPYTVVDQNRFNDVGTAGEGDLLEAPPGARGGLRAVDEELEARVLGALSPERPLDRIARLTATALRAPMAVVTLSGDAEQRLVGAYGADALLDGDCTLPLSHGLCPFALTASEPFVVEDIGDEPILRDNASSRALGLVAYAAAALLVDGRPAGTLCAIDRVARRWGPRDRAMLVDLAASAAVEVSAQDANARLERSALQLRELAAASHEIMRSDVSLEDLMTDITRRSRAIIGAHQGVASLTIGSLTTQWITAVDLSDRYAAWRDYQVHPDGSGIYAMVSETRRPVRMTQAQLQAHPRWRGFGAEVARHPPMRGWLAAPFLGRDGQCLGLIQLSDKYDGDFTAEDEAVLVQLANVTGCAIEEAYLTAERDHIAYALQASLVPDKLPQIPGIEAVARCEVPRSGQLPVGQFYDLCETPDGSWAVTVADVSGTGPQTTAVAGLVRGTLRGLLDEPSPAAALTRLNATMLRERDDLRFATVVHTRLRMDPQPRLVVSCAGHTPPILLRPGEDGRPVGRPGQVVGAIPDAAAEDVDVELREGDTVLFYTSGVVEAWRGDRSTVVDLADSLGSLSTAPLATIADAVERIARNPARKGGEGDFAIVILRVAEPGFIQPRNIVRSAH